MKLPQGVSRQMSPAQIEADKDRHARAAEIGENAAARKDAAGQRVANELTRHNKELGDRKERAKTDFQNALEKATTDEQRLAAARKYKQDLQSGQSEYETNISTTLAKPIEPNTWADRLDPKQLVLDAGETLMDAPTNGKPAAPAQAAQPVAAQPTAKTASQPTVQSSKYKVGETRTHEGATYRFDGGQWVQQPAPKATAPAKAGPKLGDVKTYNGAQYKFDGKQYVYAGAATNATR